MHTLFAAAAASNPGLIQALGLDWKLLLEQAIAFLILVGILGKYVYPILIKAIDERRESIEAGLKAAETSRQDMEKAEAKIEELLAAARKDADALLKRAQEEATGVVSDAEDKAKTRAERIVADAHNQLEADIIKARSSLKRDTAELVALATEKIIHEKLDTKKDAGLIERALAGKTPNMNQKVSRQTLAKILAEQLIASPATAKQIMESAAAYLMEHSRLGEADLLINDIAHELQIQKGLLSVEVTSALALSSEARDNLIQFMKNETDASTVQLYETVDSGLVGGMVARTPDAELDVSVRSKLRKLAAIA